MKNRPTEPHSIDRLPPHSVEVEQAVLGCIMKSPEDSMPTCITRIGANVDAFYDVRHQKLFSVFVQMYDEREPIDLITTMTWMEFQGSLEDVGGLAYISSLIEVVPSAANLPTYLDTLLGHRTSRALIRLSTETVAAVYDRIDDIETLTNAHAQDALDLAQSQISEEDVAMSPLVHQALNQIETWSQNQGVLTGIGTGFVDLDRMTTGLQPGDMVVIAARPSLGKTSIAMNIACHAALILHQPVGIFSLEMTKRSLVIRMICSEARVNIRNIQDGFLAERDFPKLACAAGRLSHAPIHINDISSMTILGLRTRARKMHRMYGIKLFVIDYLQLMTTDKKRSGSRQEEVSDISRGCKGIAKELDVPVLVLSQLNRQVEHEKNRKPRLADLRESGAIEQDADVVGFLYQPTKDDDSEYHQDSPLVNLYIAKQRNGPTGDIPLTFMKCYCRFESAAHVSSDDVPPHQEPQQEFHDYHNQNA